MSLRVIPSPVAGHVPGPASRLLPHAGAPGSVLLESGAGRVLALAGRYGMSYLLEGERSTAIVDCGSTADVDAICRGVGFLGRPAGLLLPTHLHFDHVLGLPALSARLKAPVAAGPWNRRWLVGEAPSEAFSGWKYHRFVIGWVWEGLPLPAAGDLAAAAALAVPARRARAFAATGALLRDGEPLPGFPGWRVLLSRGHSSEDLCLHHEAEGLLICGDAASNFLGGEWSSMNVDEAAARAERERLARLGARVLLPGHGPLLQGADVCRGLGVFQTRHYLRTGRARPLAV